jgi:lipoate-protein ligase A
VLGPTLRLLSFPPTVLVGRHQSLGHEADLDYCRQAGVGTARRVTGGGAIYFDPGQLGWSLVLPRSALGGGTLAGAAGQICTAVAEGLSRSLGLPVQFRPRNDLEINGRKVGGTGGFFDGATLFYQGTVLVDPDVERMFRALRVPAPKRARHALDDPRARVVGLREWLGAQTPAPERVGQMVAEALAGALGLAPVAAQAPAALAQLAARLHADEIGTEEFVDAISPPAAGAASATLPCPGGTVSAHVRPAATGGPRIGSVLFTGDFFLTPPSAIYALEAALRGVAASDIAGVVERHFLEHRVDALSVTPRSFADAASAALLAAPESHPCA